MSCNDLTSFHVIFQQPSGKPALNPGTSADKVERPSGLFPFTVRLGIMLVINNQLL